MLDAFKIKPFDLEPIYESWIDGPRFLGDPKKDPLVDDWLKQIKAGCIERGVPEEYWHKVAQHFMGEKAKARLEELKKIMAKVQGGKYRWTWKKFKVAIRNMGWDIDTAATETIKIQAKPSSPWWIIRKSEDKGDAVIDQTQRQVPSRSNSSSWTSRAKDDKADVDVERTKHLAPSRSNSSFWITRKKDDKDIDIEATPPPIPSKSDLSYWIMRKDSKDEQDGSTVRSVPSRSNTTGKLLARKSSKDEKESSVRRANTVKSNPDSKALTVQDAPKPPIPSRSNSGDVITTETHAPTWLLNAAHALDFLTSEHPKVMSTLSAILITAGSIPAIPAISAGAGGAVLASGAAHAVGAIAVGLGTLLKAQQEVQTHGSTTQTSSTTG